jgi:hypothetical protein
MMILSNVGNMPPEPLAIQQQIHGKNKQHARFLMCMTLSIDGCEQGVFNAASTGFSVLKKTQVNA